MGGSRGSRAAGGGDISRRHGRLGLRPPGCYAWAVALTALASVLLLLPFHQYACGEITIAVTPTRIPMKLLPGERGSAEVTLINQGTEEADLKPRVMLVEEEASGGLLVEQGEQCSWLSTGVAEIYLMPSEAETFPFYAEVPAGANPGLYHFALTFELAREEVGGVGLSGGVAVLVELDVLPADGEDGGGFSPAVTVSLAIVAALLLGVVMAVALWRYRNGGASESGANGADLGGKDNGD